MKRLSLTLAACGLSLLWAGAARAQTATTGTVVGTLKDARGAVVNARQVQLGLRIEF